MQEFGKINAIFEEGQTTTVTDIFIYLSPFPSVFTNHAYTPVNHQHVCTGASLNFLVLAGSINIDTIILHLFNSDGEQLLFNGSIYLFKLKFNFTCRFDKLLTLS